MTIEYYILTAIFIFLHLFFITAVIRYAANVKKLQEEQTESTTDIPINEQQTSENRTSDKPSPEHVKYVDDLITECIFADRKPKH